VDSHDPLAIVQKYERFVNYFYPVAQNIPRAQGVLKEMFIRDLLGQVNLFIVAGKSNHIGRLYEADARADYEALERFIGSWAGHINKADVYNLKMSLNAEMNVKGALAEAIQRRHKTRYFLLGELF